MSRPSAPKPDDPEQLKRFIEAAKTFGATEDEDEADRAFTKIVPPKAPKKARD